MRLLICNLCRTCEEIPEYEGQDEVDPLVEAVVFKHNQKDPMGHGGVNLPYSPIRLIPIKDEKGKPLPDKLYYEGKEEILKKINEITIKEPGFEGWAYEAINTFEEDAMKCFRQHGRPDLGQGKGCPDYWSDSKRLGRPTAVGRQARKEHSKLAVADPHLCQFCPYFSGVQTEIRHKKGMYKK
jgi:hypothetical protein